MSRDFDEKRSFPRMTVNCDIELIANDSGEKTYAVCRDLSGGGVMLISDKALEVDAGYEMMLNGGPGTPPLRASIRIIRCEPEGENFQVATRIEEILG